MRNILIIGAGRSATTLIKYLLEHAQDGDWKVTVCDSQIQLAKEKINNHERGIAIELDARDLHKRRKLISDSDVVISMLPPFMHIEVAKDCITYKKFLVNASYVSKELKELDLEVQKAGILFMCELGLDPGIDHMSAMQLLDNIRLSGGQIDSFRSYTGGLVAPESDDNPWHYKFSWSPRNVVVAGQGTAKYIEDGIIRYVPYNRIFSQTRKLDIPYIGQYESYPNRDSLSYIPLYDLHGIKTLYRGTIRHEGFCEAWNALVQLGWTDSHFVVFEDQNKTLADITESLLPPGQGTLTDRLSTLIGHRIDSPTVKRLSWLGIMNDIGFNRSHPTPADLLEDILLEKWKLGQDEKDMIIMQHEVGYSLDGVTHEISSTLIEIGENAMDTAMSRLVGLPMAIFTRLLLKQGCSLTGVHIPVHREVYTPVMEELNLLGVHFDEKLKVRC